MAPKIDKELLDISTYASPSSDYSWWFDWCKDQEPHTFWDRRLESRRQWRVSSKTKQRKQ